MDERLRRLGWVALVAAACGGLVLAWQRARSQASPIDPSRPTLGAHALVGQENDVAPPLARTPALATAAQGSSFVAVVGGFIINATPPVDSYGNAWRPFGRPVVFHGYGARFDTRAYLALDARGGPEHQVSIAKPGRPTGESTLVVVEARNAGRLVDAAQVYAPAGRHLASGAVDTDGPALLVALWWGDGDQARHRAVPDQGFRIIDRLTTLPPNSAVQCVVAVREVDRAGTYAVTWDTAPEQGAILWLFAFAPAARAPQPPAGRNSSKAAPSAIR